MSFEPATLNEKGFEVSAAFLGHDYRDVSVEVSTIAGACLRLLTFPERHVH